MKINDLIENKIFDLEKTDYYSVILGLSPSKGAKSPKLWNAAFKGLNFSCFMHPMDVSPENLEYLLKNLRLDKRFIGGAVAVPYKEDIIKYIDDVEDEAKAIGAVNCIYKDKDGRIIGANTDGAGALWSLQNTYGNINGTNVLVIGATGASAAVSTYVGKALGKKGNLFISNRDKEKSHKLTQKLSKLCSVETINWPPSKDDVKDVDIIINCTSVGFDSIKKDDNGFYSFKFYNPIGKIKDNIRISETENFEQEYVYKAAENISQNFYETKRFLGQFKNLLVFDIVYQPLTTCLLFLSNLIGHKTLSGKGMNLEQAVIAFDKTTSATGMRDLNQNEVQKYMTEVN